MSTHGAHLDEVERIADLLQHDEAGQGDAAGALLALVSKALLSRSLAPVRTVVLAPCTAIRHSDCERSTDDQSRAVDKIRVVRNTTAVVHIAMASRSSALQLQLRQQRLP